jgi:GDPmannose 4,6-dehydratase
MFNHESPRRGRQFVTRKITDYIGKLVNEGMFLSNIVDTSPAIGTFKVSNNQHTINYPKLRLGNLKASRDWGHAKDYVRALYLMLQQDEPDDYVIATGQTYSIEDFLRKAFDYVALDWKPFVYIDEKFYRPCEVEYLRGDASKAKQKLNWQPTRDINYLVKDMVTHDIQNYS